MFSVASNFKSNYSKAAMKRHAALVVLSSLAACLPGVAAKMRSTAYQAPQYQAIRQRLLHGWGTWDSRNILEQVHLPDDAAIALSFKETNWINSDYLGRALIGVQDPGEPSVRPGLHALDGNYFEYELKWKELDVKIASAAVADGSDDMVTLIEPQHSSALPHEVFVASEMLWNRPGTVSRSGDVLSIHAGGHLLNVYATEPSTQDPYAEQDTPYLALALSGPVGISAGHRRSLAEIRAILARRRVALLSRAAQFGDNADTYAGIEAVLGWNTIYEPEYDRIITTVGRIWNEQYGGYCLFGWDNFFLAYMTSLYNRDVGEANFIEHLRSMTYEGFIPNDDRGNGTMSWDHSQPPVGTLMLREIYKRYRQNWLLEAAYPDLLRWNEWWFRARMNDGLLSYGSNLAKNPYNAPDTHTKITAGYESGMDDSPMYAGVPFNPAKNTLELQDVGLNSLYVADCKALEEIARTLGRSADIPQIKQRREAIADHMRPLWNPEMGLYLNRRTDTKELSNAISPTAFYPMIAGLVDHAQAQAMVERYLGNDAEFGGQYVIPSISRSNPAFTRQRYWKGAVWPPLNFLVYLGLRDAGMLDASSTLATKSNAIFLHGWKEKGIISENYSAITGEGDDPRLSSDRFHSWGALMGFMSLIEAGKMPAPEASMADSH
jgi:hypothetical protein